MMDEVLGMVSGVEPVAQFIASDRCALTTVITLHNI